MFVYVRLRWKLRPPSAQTPNIQVFIYSFYHLYFFLHLNNHLHWEINKHQQKQQNNYNSDNHKMKAHKNSGWPFAKCFCYNRRSWKKAVGLQNLRGNFFFTVCLHVYLSHSGGKMQDRQTETINSSMLSMSFCPQLTAWLTKQIKLWESQYEVGLGNKFNFGGWWNICMQDSIVYKVMPGLKSCKKMIYCGKYKQLWQ